MTRPAPIFTIVKTKINCIISYHDEYITDTLKLRDKYTSSAISLQKSYTHISHILPICHVCHCRHMYSSNGGFFYSCGSVVPGLTKFRPGATDMQLRFLLEFFFVFVFFSFRTKLKRQCRCKY